MKVLAYKGISLISKAIRWQTRSEFSHIAVELNDGSVVEAWHKGGVVHSGSFRALHTPGTEVVVYEFDPGLTEEQELALERWLLSQVGKKYDFRSVFRFLTRRKAPADDMWFCSEYLLTGCIKIHNRLLNGNPSEQSPRDTVMSPKLKAVDVRVC